MQPFGHDDENGYAIRRRLALQADARERQARRTVIVVLLLTGALMVLSYSVWFANARETAAESAGRVSFVRSPTAVPDARQPQRLEVPNSVHLAGHIVAMDAASALGDQQAAKAQMEAAQGELLRSMKVPDARRSIDHELARAAAKRVAAVRSAVWLDRDNLFVIVKENAQRSQETIDQICLQLEPLGDTLGVVVNVQSGAATSGDDLEILSRNCQLEPGDRAFLQRNRQVDVLSPSIRAEQKANNGR